MKKRIIALIISFVITVISVIFLMYIEEKVFNPDGSKAVYVLSSSKLDKNFIITKENFDSKFKLQKRRIDQLPPNCITDKDVAYDYSLAQNMFKNDVLTTDKIKKAQDEFKDMIDKREISLTSSSSESLIAGKVRAGDHVDLIYTAKKSEDNATEGNINNLFVEQVFNSSGKEIMKDDVQSVASTVTLLVSKENAEKIQQVQAESGNSWKMIRVVDE